MTLIQAILLAITTNLASGRIWSPITWPFCYPLINGTIVGIILGDPLMGMLAGANINLAYIGWISAGGTMPSNIGVAGVYGTAITLLAKANPELAITFAIPLGLLGVLQWQLQMTVNTVWVHRLDKNAEKGELDKVWINALLMPQLTNLLIYGIPAALLVFLGGDFFAGFLDKIPVSLVNALSTVGGLLPALGVAMLLNYLGKKHLIPYFVLGFFAVTYLDLGLMAVAIFGACLSLLILYSKNSDSKASEQEDDSFSDSVLAPKDYKVRLTKSDRNKHWLVGLGAEMGYNYERMQASANLLAMVPVIKRLYTDPKDISDAMKRYLIFFNTEPSFIGNIIPGMAASLEEQRANGADISDEMINSLRTGLMGPLAGVGDSLVGGIIYPILIAIGISMALENNFAGPVMFFVLFAGIMLVLGYYLYNLGYKQGGKSIMNILGEGSNSIVKMTDALSVLGLLVTGAIGAERVLLTTPLTFTFGETSVVVQDVLNGLVPNLLPLLAILGIWKLLKKRVSTSRIVVILFIVGILGSYLGLLA